MARAAAAPMLPMAASASLPLMGEMQTHIFQASLRPSCFNLTNAGITGVHHHTPFMGRETFYITGPIESL